MGQWHDAEEIQQFIQVDAASRRGLVQALDLMLKSLAELENNTRKAGLALSFWVLSATALAVFLPSSDGKADLVGAFIWIANLPAAWFLAQEHKRLGRDPWFLGLISIIPALALLHFIVLYVIACATDHRPEV